MIKLSRPNTRRRWILLRRQSNPVNNLLSTSLYDSSTWRSCNSHGYKSAFFNI